jgi:hypothetical protein
MEAISTSDTEQIKALKVRINQLHSEVRTYYIIARTVGYSPGSDDDVANTKKYDDITRLTSELNDLVNERRSMKTRAMMKRYR